MNHIKSPRLEIKIIALLGSIIFLIIYIYTVIFSQHYQKYEDKVIGEESISTLHSLETSVDAVLRNADEYSKMLVADSIIQRQMETGDLFVNVSEQYAVINRIYSILQFTDSVNAVWLLDNKGGKLTVGGSPSISQENRHGANEDYSALQKPYGESKLLLSKRGNDQQLSLVRSYNSLEDFNSLGIIGIDIDEDVFQRLISNVINLEDEQIVILNEENDIIFSGGHLLSATDLAGLSQKIKGEENEILENVKLNNIEYLLSGVRNDENGWKIIRYMPILRNRVTSDIVKFNLILIVLIGLLILIGTVAVSNTLTLPIQQLLSCMKDVENGKLTRIHKKTYLEEFRTLFKSYNHMVDRIELLIQETIDRQRRIRQVEMNEIQEQMKPHFLYNTLDSIEALAMMGEADKVSKLIEALGDFYRKSVSGGREFLTVGEEIRMTEDYVDIMKIRFEDSFVYQIDLDESCRNYLIPKLTIQPLVENAFQHGIRAKKQFGEILISCSREDGKLHILIRDNGEGIPEEIILELAENKEPVVGKSLGLRGTIERLRLLYENAFSYSILNTETSEIHIYIDTAVLEEKANG